MELQKAYRSLAENICCERGIKYVFIKSNFCKQLYSMVHEMIVSNLFMSYALALEKLFGVFYFSSSHTYLSFAFEEFCSEYHQLFNVHCFLTESLEFYTTGSEAIRHEKTAYVSKFELPKKYLMVCRKPYLENGVLKNCSMRSKCTRTMIDLDLYDSLDLFDEIFDVKNYRKNPNYYWGVFVF